MKFQSIINYFSIFVFVLFTCSLNAQNDVSTDSTGYPGDGFSLEGALELLKESKSLEDFEKKLNSDDNYVNNLDLNEDGEVDYVRVIDTKDDKAHAITLQVPLSEKESQDVAVIGVQEEGKENTVLQIIGDADVYGEETLVEPFEEEAKSDGKGGPSANARIARIYVNVYFWPCIRFIYRPSYVVYVSPWRWHYYPKYWRPWRPYSWHVCHTHRVRYHRHYRHTHTHRVTHAHRVYAPHRRTSKTVRTRTTTVKAVRGPAGNTAVKKTTTTTRKASTANKKAATANTKASTANKKATTANTKASTANKKAATANTKASTANKKAAKTNTKASTANKKAAKTNTKASTANKKAAKTNTKASTANKKAAKTNTKAASGNKSTKAKSSQQRSKQQKSKQPKATKQKSSKQKSSKQGSKSNKSRSGGKSRKGNR